jgi:hypothetical protein
VSAAVSRRCPGPRGRFPRVAHPCAAPRARGPGALDLHVLGAPPAFVLSQDQTLSLVRSSRQPAGSQRSTPPSSGPGLPQRGGSPCRTTASRPARRCPRQRRPAPPPAHPLSTQPTDDEKEHPRRQIRPVHRTGHFGWTIDLGIPPIAAGGLMWVWLAACQGSQRSFPTRRCRQFLLWFQADSDEQLLGVGRLLDQGQDPTRP